MVDLFTIAFALVLLLAAHFCILLATDEWAHKQSTPIVCAAVLDLVALAMMYAI